MNEYIKQWNEVIGNGSVDNNYKMAWARSIVKLCVEKENPQGIEKEKKAKDRGTFEKRTVLDRVWED